MMQFNFEIIIYNLHDGKIFYFLTKHSLFNCKHHPVPSYTCKREEGVSNPYYICKIIDHDDQVKYYNRSLDIWNDKKECSRKKIIDN